MTTQKRTTCAIEGCYLPRHSWSTYCATHTSRSQYHGHPGLRSGVRESDLKPYAHRIERMMALYGNNRATQVALQIAEEILNYKPQYDRTTEREVSRMMQMARDEGTTPMALLRRVCLHFFYLCDHPGRCKGSAHAEDMQLARIVMRLVPLQKSGKRWAAVPLRRLGSVCRESLYKFAHSMHKREQMDADKQHDRQRALMDFDAPAEGIA
jgi:hypothetical protein